MTAAAESCTIGFIVCRYPSRMSRRYAPCAHGKGSSYRRATVGVAADGKCNCNRNLRVHEVVPVAGGPHQPLRLERHRRLQHERDRGNSCNVHDAASHSSYDMLAPCMGYIMQRIACTVGRGADCVNFAVAPGLLRDPLQCFYCVLPVLSPKVEGAV